MSDGAMDKTDYRDIFKWYDVRVKYWIKLLVYTRNGLWIFCTMKLGEENDDCDKIVCISSIKY